KPASTPRPWLWGQRRNSFFERGGAKARRREGFRGAAEFGLSGGDRLIVFGGSGPKLVTVHGAKLRHPQKPPHRSRQRQRRASLLGAPLRPPRLRTSASPLHK